MTTDAPTMTRERLDFLEALDKHRALLRQTVQGMTDEQIGARPTTSALCLGGIIKHVTRVESRWAQFILVGTEAMLPMDETTYAEHLRSFEMLPGDTLAGLLERYDDVARVTNEIVQSIESLDVAHPLPPAPWFEPGAEWSARRVLAHIIAETAQHAGHADIIRESIDGAKTMG